MVVAWLLLQVGQANSPLCRPVASIPLVAEASDAALRREVVIGGEFSDERSVRRLAFALHADAVEREGKWRLFRSEATTLQVRADDVAALQSAARNVAAQYEALTKDRKTPAFDTAVRVLEAGRAYAKEHPEIRIDDSPLKANQTSPAAKLLAATLGRLSAEAFEKAVPGEITEYSTQPSGPQIALRMPDALLRAYMAEQKEFARMSEKAIREGRLDAGPKWIFPADLYVDGPRQVVLYVNRIVSPPIFTMSVFGPDGMREANPTFKSAPRSMAPPSPSRPSLGSSAMGTDTRAGLRADDVEDPGFRPENLDPVKREPLSLYVRDALMTYARARGFEDVVACVPDSLLEGVRKCVAGSDWNLDAIARELNEADCEESVQEGVLVIRPKSPLHAEALRLDRRPVSGLLKALSARGDTLDTFVAYHAGVANYEQSAARRVLERPIVAYYRLNRNDNWKLPHRLLAVIGKLSPDERRKMFSTGRVPIDAPKYRKDLEWFALFFQPSAQRPPPPGGPDMQVRVVERAQMEGTDFELQPSRVVASSGARWLQLEDLGSDLLVQRVRKGTDRLEDSQFQSFSSLLETFPGDDLRVWLGKEFDYHWAKDGRWLNKVKIGPRVEIGPFRIRERLGQSSKPVPMDRLPVDP